VAQAATVARSYPLDRATADHIGREGSDIVPKIRRSRATTPRSIVPAASMCCAMPVD